MSVHEIARDVGLIIDNDPSNSDFKGFTKVQSMTSTDHITLIIGSITHVLVTNPPTCTHQWQRNTWEKHSFETSSSRSNSFCLSFNLLSSSKFPITFLSTQRSKSRTLMQSFNRWSQKQLMRMTSLPPYSCALNKLLGNW